MTSLNKTIRLWVAIGIMATLLACSEKPENTSYPDMTSVSSVTPDRIKQLQNEADAGDPDAQYNLAYLYEHGLGLAKDEAKALELYQKSSDQGHSEATNNLDAMKSSR